jgi:EAL domain-containing protein (putative c-di-GMP-specific phosphodiesterase class I)
MASLCRNLDMMMIGEMIENVQEAEFLFESGVQYGQGYFIGKPSTDEAILDTHNKNTGSYAGLFVAKRFRNDEDKISKKAI